MKQTNNMVVDHRLGNLYPVLDELHKNLKEITFVAQHIHSLRSGNIELGMNEDGMMQWKYTAEGDDAWKDFVNVTEIAKDTVIESAGESINSLTDKYVKLVEDSELLSTLVNSIELRIGAVEELTTELQQSSNSHGSSINTLKSEMISAQSAITDLQEVTNAIGEMQQTILSMGNDIVVIKNSIEEHDRRLRALEEPTTEE